MQASEKETIPKDDKKDEEVAKDTNGDKNGDTVTPNAKLSLGEIAAIDGEIAKAKTEQLQVLHNVRHLTSVLLCHFSQTIVLAILQQEWKRTSNQKSYKKICRFRRRRQTEEARRAVEV